MLPSECGVPLWLGPDELPHLGLDVSATLLGGIQLHDCLSGYGLSHTRVASHS